MESAFVSSENKMLVRLLLLFISYLGFGVCYGMLHEEWSFVRSLYFAISALSTGGLEAPTIPPEGSIVMTALGCWVLTGVPVYAMCLGLLANVFIQDYETKKRNRKIKKTLQIADIKFAHSFDAMTGEHEAGGGEGAEIDFTKYLQFSLVRLGVVDMGLLGEIKDQFQELDCDGNGILSVDELYAAMSFSKYDIQRDNKLDLIEFAKLWEETVKPKLGLYTPSLMDPRAVGRALEDLDESGDGHLEIKEFVQFYEFSRVKQGHDWFQENGEQWLRGDIRLPTDMLDPPDNGVDDRDISSFYYHMQTPKGQRWLQANGEKWMNGECNLPAPFMAVRPIETYVPSEYKIQEAETE